MSKNRFVRLAMLEKQHNSCRSRPKLTMQSARMSNARKVAAIDPAAREAAKKAGLDKNRSKLLQVANEETSAAQLAKVGELRRTKKTAD
jgi:hypothetical protein